MSHIKAYEKPFVFVDTETTGLNFLEHEVIQIAIIREEKNGPPIYWNSLIKPLHIQTADPKALEINGYAKNPTWWDNAPTMEEIGPEIQKLLQNSIIVGQNISFDLAFLQAQMRPLDLWNDIGHHNIDTATLALEHLLPAKVNSVSLKNTCKLLGIYLGEGHHDASYDVAVTREVFYKLLRASFVKRLWWKLKHRFMKP